jgi:hypothetical protein
MLNTEYFRAFRNLTSLRNARLKTNPIPEPQQETPAHAPTPAVQNPARQPANTRPAPRPQASPAPSAPATPSPATPTPPPAGPTPPDKLEVVS